jgi:mannose-6-phosphate isomerase class I
MGLDGKPRALHIDKSLAVSELEALPEILHTAQRQDPIVPLVDSAYFHAELRQFQDGQTLLIEDNPNRRHFDALTCIDGSVIVEAAGTQVVLDLGRTVLIPAALASYSVTGQARVLRSIPAHD